MLRSIFWLVN